MFCCCCCCWLFLFFFKAVLILYNFPLVLLKQTTVGQMSSKPTGILIFVFLLNIHTPQRISIYTFWSSDFSCRSTIRLLLYYIILTWEMSLQLLDEWSWTCVKIFMYPSERITMNLLTPWFSSNDLIFAKIMLSFITISSYFLCWWLVILKH